MERPDAKVQLDRLAEQARRALDMDAGGIAIGDSTVGSVVEAVCGAAWVKIGQRFGNAHSVFSRVLRSGRAAIFDASERERATERECDGQAFAQGVAVPVGTVRVEGALALVSTNASRRLDNRDLALGCDFATVAARVLAQPPGLHHPAGVPGEVRALVAAAELRHAGLDAHGISVRRLATSVGRHLELTPDALEELDLAAQLHDTGKLRVPAHILDKPGPLTPDEWNVIRCHPRWGFELLGATPGLELAAIGALFHHERWDGAGYPYGLSGDQIPLVSRIITVCDAFGAMTAERPYKAAVPPSVAVKEIRNLAGAQFDPDVVDALVRSRIGLASNGATGDTRARSPLSPHARARGNSTSAPLARPRPRLVTTETTCSSPASINSS